MLFINRNIKNALEKELNRIVRLKNIPQIKTYNAKTGT